MGLSEHHRDWVNSHVVDSSNRAGVDDLDSERDRWAGSEALRGVGDRVVQSHNEGACLRVQVRDNCELHRVSSNLGDGHGISRDSP